MSVFPVLRNPTDAHVLSPSSVETNVTSKLMAILLSHDPRLYDIVTSSVANTSNGPHSFLNVGGTTGTTVPGISVSGVRVCPGTSVRPCGSGSYVKGGFVSGTYVAGILVSPMAKGTAVSPAASGVPVAGALAGAVVIGERDVPGAIVSPCGRGTYVAGICVGALVAPGARLGGVGGTPVAGIVHGVNVTGLIPLLVWGSQDPGLMAEASIVPSP